MDAISPYVDVRNTSDHSNRNCPPDAQEPDKCSSENVEQVNLVRRLDDVFPDL